MADSEEKIREALEGVLSLYDIELELDSSEESVEDYSEIINKTQERLDDLNEKAEDIYKRTGMNRDQLEAYAMNPNNFSKEQWEALQKVREACEKYKQEAHARVGEEMLTEQVEVKKKKQSKRFAKKKNWIPL